MPHREEEVTSDLAHLAITPGDDENKVDGGGFDVKEVLQDTILADTEYSKDDFAKLKRKIDWRLLPLNIYGLKTSVPMSNYQYSLLSVVFYAAYAVFELPCTVLLQKLSVGKTLSIFMFCWGIILLGQAFAKNWATMMVMRALQGVFESNITPGFAFLITNWYTTEEHNGRILFFASANQGWGIITSLVMYAIGIHAQNNPGPLDPWRQIALFLAAQTIVCSVLCYLFLGSPHEIRWLKPRERDMASARILSSHTGSETTGKKWDWDQAIEAFTDPVTYCILVNVFLSCICNGSLSIFGSVINVSFGFTNTQVVLYSIPQSAVSILWFAGCFFVTGRWKNMRIYSMVASVLPPSVPFTVPFFSTVSLIASNCTGKTKRSVVSTICFIAYTTGNIAGSQVMASSEAPHYIKGTIIVAVCLGVEVAVLLLWRMWLAYQNRIRASKIAEMNLTPDEIELRARQLAAENVTDMKNIYFKYTL
ncbi:hypothetical protein EHS25_008967 [Saitozyma podzolica]|uniref:Major facilitator superfamily (MFS) profile domain-containing protein n=1 Tax=Saitozyma podzolica TaxID=1890683 RepID=A0A427YKH3_9TREE|nr:hypothetical protein EHS25_008967 [Saitozyma podzolica]